MERLIPDEESLLVEFKSDRKKLSDNDLVLAAVCLTNAEGGTIYLGVEDNGNISGLHEDRASIQGLTAAIANKTFPPLSGVRAELTKEEGKQVAIIRVPKSSHPVARSDGKLQRRRLGARGTPECIPFFPHEFITRSSDLQKLDFSAQPVEDATLSDFAPVERERLREVIKQNLGDRFLLNLNDEELEGALGLARTVDGRRVPTVTGLLLLGKEEALQTHLPTHEVALQDLDGTQVRANDFYRWPLLRLYEQVEQFYRARVVEEEINVGLFRVPVPSLDSKAFRETVINALTHRDYTRMGTVYIRWETESLIVSNPGGFVDGVSIDNLLVTEPKPRNPSLADAFKRLGLAERTGRGVDLIYQGLLRYGRPRPSFDRSDTTTVVAELSCAAAELTFLGMILEEENKMGIKLGIDSLMVLSNLRETRRTDVKAVAMLIQKNTAQARSVLEGLVEGDLIKPQGKGRTRDYTLSPKVYRKLGKPESYTRQAGFNRFQQEQMVVGYVDEHGIIRRAEAMKLCNLDGTQASRLLKRMVREGHLEMRGSKKGAHYLRPSLIQKNTAQARSVLEGLVEGDLIKPQGKGRTRDYTLSPKVYRKLGKPESYTRQAGFNRFQQEQMIVGYVSEHGIIRRAEAMKLCNLDGAQASRLLKRMVREGHLEMRGSKKGAHYLRPS